MQCRDDLVPYNVSFAEGHATIQSAEQQRDHVTESGCQWQLRGAQHGSEVTVYVTCVNGVQLVTKTASLPAIVVIRPPDVTQVCIYLFVKSCVRKFACCCFC